MEALIGHFQKLGGRSQLHLGVRDRDMAEIGSQCGQQGVYVLALAMPGHKAIAGIAVAQIVEARTWIPFPSTEPAPAQGLPESRVHNLAEETAALEVDEEGILWRGREDTGPLLHVALQYRGGGKRDGHPARFAEFALMYVEPLLTEIDIGQV